MVWRCGPPVIHTHTPIIRGGGGSRAPLSGVDVRALTVIPAGDKWGAFAEEIDSAEQRARLQALGLWYGSTPPPRVADPCRLLAQAETDPAALEPASVALNRLAPADRRNVLAS